MLAMEEETLRVKRSVSLWLVCFVGNTESVNLGNVVLFLICRRSVLDMISEIRLIFL